MLRVARAEEVASLPGVAHVVGNSYKHRLAEIVVASFDDGPKEVTAQSRSCSGVELGARSTKAKFSSCLDEPFCIVNFRFS